MYDLDTIHAINDRPQLRQATGHRDSSFCSSRAGVILHSATHRNTLFIAREHQDKFLTTARRHTKNGATRKLNELIESYFAV